MRSRITGTGSYTPERILTNAELERMVATSDQWIAERTGIRERRIQLIRKGLQARQKPAFSRRGCHSESARSCEWIAALLPPDRGTDRSDVAPW